MSAIPAYYETAFGLEPFEPYDHQADTEELEAAQAERPERNEQVVRWFECPRCDGHGAMVDHDDVTPRAIFCPGCHGEGRLGATEDDIEHADSIGSNNPFCRHEWAGGDEEYDRCYCLRCGADGDA